MRFSTFIVTALAGFAAAAPKAPIAARQLPTAGLASIQTRISQLRETVTSRLQDITAAAASGNPVGGITAALADIQADINDAISDFGVAIPQIPNVPNNPADIQSLLASVGDLSTILSTVKERLGALNGLPTGQLSQIRTQLTDVVGRLSPLVSPILALATRAGNGVTPPTGQATNLLNGAAGLQGLLSGLLSPITGLLQGLLGNLLGGLTGGLLG